MHGQLFTSDFLLEGILETPGWSEAEPTFVAFREDVIRIFSFSGATSELLLNEAQTEHEVILPVLKALGWTEYLSQATSNA